MHKLLIKAIIWDEVLSKAMRDDYPDSKVHGASVGPIWGRQDPGGPHVGPMNYAFWVVPDLCIHICSTWILSPMSMLVITSPNADNTELEMILF